MGEDNQAPPLGGDDAGPAKSPKSRLVAGLLGLFLGWLGLHRFYLGFPKTGIAQPVVTLITAGIGGLWGVIEGLLLLFGGMNKDGSGLDLGPPVVDFGTPKTDSGAPTVGGAVSSASALSLLVPCKDCGKDVSRAAKSCPNCGAPVPVEKAMVNPQDQKRTKKIVGVVILCVVGLWIIGTLVGPGKESPNSQGTNSLDPGLASVVGPKPESSSFDGSVACVEAWFKENLKDPSSLKDVEWYQIAPEPLSYMDGQKAWACHVKFRAKNGFGGYDIGDKVFYIRHNTVVGVMDR